MGFTPQIVAGVFIGFDDNRSLGNGETGSVAAVPIFVEFMQEAIKGYPPEEFQPPKNAKFAMVRGIREAFRPGTEPRVAIVTTGGGAQPVGAQPYNKVWSNGQVTGAPSAGAATAPPRKPSDDVTGLY
jgi:penicillin-binding protein 1A